MVCHNYRRIPAIALAKKIINEGALGQIYHFRARYAQDWIVDPEFPLDWRLQKNVSGSGVHGDINSHIIDLGRYLVGEFKEVCGLTQTFITERPLADGAGKGQGLGAKAARKMGKVTVDDAAIRLADLKTALWPISKPRDSRWVGRIKSASKSTAAAVRSISILRT